MVKYKHLPKTALHDFNRLKEATLTDPDVQRFLTAHKTELKEDAVERGLSKLFEFVEVRDKFKANQTEETGGFVPTLEVAQGMIVIAYHESASLKAKRQANQIAQRYQSFGISALMKNAHVKDFYLDTPSRKDAYRAMAKFGQQYLDKNNKNLVKGMYLCGPFGVGKTYLLSAMANLFALRGVQTTLIHFPSLSVEMKYAPQSSNTKYALKVMKETPILILDDLGGERLNPWLRDEVLIPVLQTRLDSGRPTCFSSNLTLSQLFNHCAKTEKGGVQKDQARKLINLIEKLSTEMPFEGENLRQPPQ